MSFLKHSLAKHQLDTIILPLVKRHSPAACLKPCLIANSNSCSRVCNNKFLTQKHYYYSFQTQTISSGTLQKIKVNIPSTSLNKYKLDNKTLFATNLEVKPVARLQCRGMAGHSHWANIKHQKERSDAKKGALHAAMVTKIKNCVKVHGSTDPKKNLELAKHIADAKTSNIPNEVIQRAINKATSSLGIKLLEGRGPGGSLFLLELNIFTRSPLTNRVNNLISKYLQGGGLGATGSVQSYFNHQGVINALPLEEGEIDMDKYLEVALEAGAEEVTEQKDEEGNSFLEFTCDPDDLQQVKKLLEDNELNVWFAENVFTPLSTVTLDDKSLNDYKLFCRKLNSQQEFFQIENLTTNIEDFDPGLDV